MLIVLVIFLEVLLQKEINRQLINIWQVVKITNLKLFNGKCLNLLKNNKSKIYKNKKLHKQFLIIKSDLNKYFIIIIWQHKKRHNKQEYFIKLKNQLKKEYLF